MLNSSFYLTERMISLHLAEEHRQAEARRLLAEARAGRTGWLSRQCCRALCQLGRFFVSVGQRLLQDAAPPSLPLEGHVGSRA